MFNNGVPIEVVRDYLGHSIIETTWGYIYNNLGKKNTSSMIHESLSSMSGFEVPVLNCSQIDEIKKPREPCK